jgi:hypothetical protein
MGKVSEKSNLQLAIHFLKCFPIAWISITVVFHFVREMSWSIAVTAGLIFSGVLMSISLISILYTRKNRSN